MKSRWAVLALLCAILFIPTFLTEFSRDAHLPESWRHFFDTHVYLPRSLSEIALFACLIPGGLLTDRFGSRAVLICCAGFITAISAFAVVVPERPIPLMIASGCARGLLMGPIFKLVGEQFERRERSLACAAVLSVLLVSVELRHWLPSNFHYQFGSSAEMPAPARFLLSVLVVASSSLGALMNGALPREHTVVFTKTRTERWDVNDLVRNPAMWVLLAVLGLRLATFLCTRVLPGATFVRSVRLPIGSLQEMDRFGYVGLTIGILLIGSLGAGAFWERKSLLVGGCLVVTALLSCLSLVPQLRMGGEVAEWTSGFFLWGAMAPLTAVLLDCSPPAWRGSFAGSVIFVSYGGLYALEYVLRRNPLSSEALGFSLTMGSLIFCCLVLFALQYAMRNRDTDFDAAVPA